MKYWDIFELQLHQSSNSNMILVTKLRFSHVVKNKYLESFFVVGTTSRDQNMPMENRKIRSWKKKIIIITTGKKGERKKEEERGICLKELGSTNVV